LKDSCCSIDVVVNDNINTPVYQRALCGKLLLLEDELLIKMTWWC